MTTMQQTDKSDYSLLRTQPRFTWKVCKPLDKRPEFRVCDKQAKRFWIFLACQTMMADTGYDNKINNKSGDSLFF